ncbi:MAG: hypothetical protein EXR99_00240 [Gemmataceae bacterium]|nr:hypothetical protein [Gemmataceae bacterium]
MFRKNVLRLALVALCLPLITSHPVTADPLTQDITEEFKRIYSSKEDPQRKTKLTSLVEGSLSLGQLSRIIRLPDWQYVEKTMALGDANIEVRNSAIKAFKSRSHKVLQTGNNEEKLEIAVLVGETAFSNLNDETSEFLDQMAQRSKYLRKELGDFGPDLAKMARSGSPGLVRASVLAMSKIETNPALFAEVVGDLLSSSNANRVENRRSAAEGMNFRLKIVGQLLREIRVVRTQDNVGLVTDLLDTSRLLFPIAIKALNDKDALVRENITLACRNATATIVEVDYIIPRGEVELALSERPDVMAVRAKGFREALNRHELLINAYRDAGHGLGGHAINHEKDLKVRLASLDVLEDLAIIRRKLAEFESLLVRLEKLAGLAVPNSSKAVSFDLFPDSHLQELVNNLSTALLDTNAKVRLNTVDVLDVMFIMPDLQTRLLKAPGDLVKNLAQVAGRDSNKMVKYGAIRSLKRIAPLKYETVIQSLGLALYDEDLDVRIEAAKALGHYGDKALPVLHTFQEMVGRGDPDARMALMQTLEKMGTGAQKALGAVSKNLKSHDPRVRVQAADTLGAFGKLSQAQVPALNARLDDPDSSVRNAVSSALLKIRSER